MKRGDKFQRTRLILAKGQELFLINLTAVLKLFDYDVDVFLVSDLLYTFNIFMGKRSILFVCCHFHFSNRALKSIKV